MSSQHDNGSPLQWDPIECKAYIVEVVGNTERYPQREDYEVGSLTLQNRLHRRYGEDYAKSCSKVLRDFLEDLETGTREEQEIWREWRIAHGARVVRLHHAWMGPSINSFVE